MASGMNVFAVGASRNIGYITSLRLLKKGTTVTMLLRNPSSMDGDAELQKYVKSGQARLVKGDAMKLEDVANGWAEAQKASASGHVDAVFFAVGGQLEKVTLTGGGRISTPNLCTASMLNVLRSMPASHRAPSAQPKLVVISSTGITKRSHEHIPLLERMVYSWLLDHPHTDKFGMERVLAHVSGAAWRDAEYRSLEGVLPPDAEWTALDGVPEAGSFKNLLIVRPAWLTDGPCKAEGEGGKKVKRYVVADDDEVPVGYAISRKDVAYFVAEEALDPARWEEWKGRRVSLAY